MLSIFSFKLTFCIGNNSIFCQPVEKQSLLNFKQSLKDPNSLLSSWDGTVNCCKWKGVICNNLTGHVHQLRLQNVDPFGFGGFKGNLNPSLLNLKYLKFLDLSGHNFGGKIPSFIGSFTNLEYLNLSGTGFHGKVPHTLGNLSNLHTLDLEINNQLVGVESVDSLEWVSGLSELEYLNMNSVNLSRANNWAQVINSLPSLVELHFESCSLDLMAPLDYSNMSNSLKYLYLSDNKIDNQPSVTTTPWIFQLTELLSIDLSSNGFDGPIPTISNATKLQQIHISFNNLISTIPDWIYLCKNLEFLDLSENLLSGPISNSIANLTSLNTFSAGSNLLSGKIPEKIANLCNIQSLDLSENNFQGEISDSFGNMSECFLESLEDLTLPSNQLSGHLTNRFGEFKSLQHLDLSNNSLSGLIPFNIGNLSSLKTLELYDNKFTGTLLESFGQLFNLQFLYIDDNRLEGVVTETQFANLTNLETLFASGNHLTLNVSPNWNPPFQLGSLHIASWNLGVSSEIPPWLEKQKYIVGLDLSNTGISGNIPSWVWKIPYLALSHNSLHGKIPDLLGPENGLNGLIYLGSNQFRGPLPRIADTVLHLDLSNNSFSGGISHFVCDRTYKTYGLTLLQLGGNQLSGELPDCWKKWPSLQYLNLASNNMSGSIPNSVGYLEYLQSLSLSDNRLSGRIPFTMHRCTKLVKMDLGDNGLHGSIPTWVGTDLAELTFLILRSNKLSGEISSDICRLNSLQILDLSDNKLSGKIPRCFSNFTAMATKRSLVLYYYSYDLFLLSYIERASIAIKGSEFQYGTTLSLVTTINLSHNNLSGDIPKELTSLVELRSLNLSQNHLTGSISDNIGDMKQLESLDFSRNSLSGRIPVEFAHLSFLNYLNLSYNKLTGEIPKSTQLQSLDASSFIGNDLCGPPLTSTCSGDGDGDKEDENDDDESEIDWYYVILSLGYAVGFSAVCITLVLNKSWREAYFGLLHTMWDKLYVYVCIKCNKLSGPRL
ncbi:hypothetical protein ACS0TY_036661 [Phlomoides rotata]